MINEVAALKQQASQLRKDRQCEEAIACYQELWTNHREQCNEWEGWGYAYCLRKEHRATEALEICRQVYQIAPSFEQNNNLYGWCIYDLVFAKTARDDTRAEDEMLKAANAIVELTAPGTYSPYTHVVMRMMEYYKKRPSYPAGKILEWSSRIAPDQLSDQPGQGVDDDGHTVAFASEREKWYGERSKALLESGRYQECLDLVATALESIPSFHHDNDVWFRWRRALAKAQLGDKETAIAELKALLTRKRDWFIELKIAQFEFDLGQTEEALNYALDAALNVGDLEYKWELFLLLGLIFQQKSQVQEAARHILLAVTLRQEHDWNIPPTLAEAMQQVGVDASVPEHSIDLVRELQPLWKSMKLTKLQSLCGEIKSLLPSGKAGFIRGDDRHDYYFKLRSFEGSRRRIQIGLRVTFYIEKSLDPTKCDNAVNIIEASRQVQP